MSTFKLAVLTTLLVAFGASACSSVCYANNYYKSDDTCEACDSTAIAGTVDTTNTYVSCSADTPTTKMVLLKQNGVEATAFTGCASGYFYTRRVTASGSEAAGKCEACHATAITGVANKAATTHVSCTSTAANTKRLTVTATGQEATAQNGCASGYFYTPMVTTSGSEASGKCEACDETTIANLGGHISCTSASSALTISSSVTTNCGIPPATATSTAHNAVLSLSIRRKTHDRLFSVWIRTTVNVSKGGHEDKYIIYKYKMTKMNEK